MGGEVDRAAEVMRTEMSFWETCLASASASFGQLGTSAPGT